MSLKTKILWAVAVLLLAVCVYAVARNSFSSWTANAVSGDAKIVAEVNGIKITGAEVARAKAYLEAQTKQAVDDADALERVVSEKLIIEDAEKQNFVFTTEDAEAQISAIMVKQNQTLDYFKSQARAHGKNYADEIEYYRRQFLVEKYLGSIVPTAEVSDVEALNYYNENKASMFTGEVAVSYEQIAEPLKATLAKKKGNDFINEYVKGLRENAKIVIY